jgi:hypothetical protein
LCHDLFGSTAQWLGTASRTDEALCFMPGAGHHYKVVPKGNKKGNKKKYQE